MAKKFYAVKNGKTPGIFETWDECKKSVDGYSGAVFKSFKTKDEALAFLGIEIRNTSDSCMFKLLYFILKYGNGTLVFLQRASTIRFLPLESAGRIQLP